MKIGSIGYSTDQGLGILLKAFYDHKVVTNVLVVKHQSRENHFDWFPGSPITQIRPFNRYLAMHFCNQVDVMLFFETPFDWSLIDYCRSHGIKTVLMPMYECEPRQLPATPDLFLCPSLLDLQYYPDGGIAERVRQQLGLAGASVSGPRSLFLPVPVKATWRRRERARVFVHNAGHGGLKGRNGTAELIDAMPFVKSDVRLIVRSQNPLGYSSDDPRVVIDIGTIPQDWLYADGDVFVFPEKFNGLSLPLQEAYAAGMLVMCCDRFPMNTWLPRQPLIPVDGYQKSRIGPPYNEFDEAIVRPEDIAATIDAWYDRDITAFSDAGKQWSEEHSWEKLGPKYLEVLRNIP